LTVSLLFAISRKGLHTCFSPVILARDRCSGGGASGSINVVRKSGVNIHHGDTFLFVQNGTLNPKEPLTNETPKPELDRGRVGFALGGPDHS